LQCLLSLSQLHSCDAMLAASNHCMHPDPRVQASHGSKLLRACRRLALLGLLPEGCSESHINSLLERGAISSAYTMLCQLVSCLSAGARDLCQLLLSAAYGIIHRAAATAQLHTHDHTYDHRFLLPSAHMCSPLVSDPALLLNPQEPATSDEDASKRVQEAKVELDDEGVELEVHVQC
jgi:hypothetical protein